MSLKVAERDFVAADQERFAADDLLRGKVVDRLVMRRELIVFDGERHLVRGDRGRRTASG